MNKRTLKNWVASQETRDGEGVRIFRVAGRHLNEFIDPFLMIDEMRALDSTDYIGDFPPHPHRGFETITYMLKGRFRHTDHMGKEGVIGPGDVQWMTAGRGVVHGKMPEKTEGAMHGFQIWINLPSAEKMKPAAYRDLTAECHGVSI